MSIYIGPSYWSTLYKYHFQPNFWTISVFATCSSETLVISIEIIVLKRATFNCSDEGMVFVSVYLSSTYLAFTYQGQVGPIEDFALQHYQ